MGQGDTIKPSATEHTFDAAGGNFTVTTEGYWTDAYWYVNDKEHHFRWFCKYITHEEDTVSIEDYSPVGTDIKGYYAPFGIKTAPFFSYGSEDEAELIKVESSWYTIDMSMTETIVFTVSPNETGKVRTIGLHLIDHGVGDFITITQLTK